MKQILIKNVTIYVGDAKCTKLENFDILLNGNTISKIAKNITTSNCKIIDGTGKFLTPGLINLHAHLPASGESLKLGKSTTNLINFIVNHKLMHVVGRYLGKKSAKIELMSGVTTVRAVGGVWHFDTQVRNFINNHPRKGARLFVCDYPITVPGGHMCETLSYVINNVEEGYRLINDLKSHDVDLIKLMITGGVLDATEKGKPGVLKMKLDIVKPLVEKAHELGLKVSAHVESSEGVEVAILSGVDSIEHGSLFDDSLTSNLIKNHSAIVATLSPAVPIALMDYKEVGVSEISSYNGKYLTKQMILCYKKAIQDGIIVGLGNDTGCPYVPHYVFWRELELFHKCINVSRDKVLSMATSVNAKILDKQDIIGSVEEGKIADLVLLNKDPMNSFKAFEDISLIFKEGLIIRKPRAKHNKKIDMALDNLLNLDIEKIINEL